MELGFPLLGKTPVTARYKALEMDLNNLALAHSNSKGSPYSLSRVNAVGLLTIFPPGPLASLLYIDFGVLTGMAAGIMAGRKS